MASPWQNDCKACHKHLPKAVAGTATSISSSWLERLDRFATNCSLVIPVCLSQSAGPNPNTNKSRSQG